MATVHNNAALSCNALIAFDHNTEMLSQRGDALMRRLLALGMLEQGGHLNIFSVERLNYCIALFLLCDILECHVKAVAQSDYMMMSVSM